MSEEPTLLDGAGAGAEAAHRHAHVAALEAEVDHLRARVAHFEEREIEHLQDRVAHFEKTAPGRYWSHLSSADFMNSSFAFSALAVLSAFPFLAVSSAAIGGDIRTVIVARMGLNPQATHDIENLIATGNQAIATLTWFSAIVLVLGGIGMAATLSAWYHRIYERTPPRGLVRRYGYQTAGVVAFSLYISAQVWIFDEVRPVGGRGLVFLLTFLTTVHFWWWSSYMLLYRKVPLRQMFPAGVATGVCLTGLGIVSAFFFSGQVTSGQKSYGPAGVVIALITFLVGFGVCLHIGAVFGRMWNEYKAERASLDDAPAATAGAGARR